jgi:lipopolysaccharide transport system ATP-binding protein
MSNTVIRVEELAKKYVLTHQEKGYKTFRGTITNATKSLSGMFQSQKQVSPSKEEFWALKDVSFEIKQGDRVGIIGRNGAGKSTLLKILSRITEPTDGCIGIKGRVASLLEVGTGFHPELTGRENIFLNGAILGMSKVEIQRKFDEIVAFAEVEKFLDTPVKRYSSGMYVRLAFAVAAHLEPEVLIIDEVLAVGDSQFQKKCLGKMEDVSAKEGRTVLFVSHNMATIKQLCNTGILLERGSLKAQGSMERVMDSYEKSIFYSQSKILTPGVMYENLFIPHNANFWITKIEMLDELGKSKLLLSTWDYVNFRIHYVAKETIHKGSGVFSVTTLDNTNLLLCSTMPDRTVMMEISEGEHYFDCSFQNWPLAAGQYLIQAGLAVPMREWLCQTKEAIPITTESKDIYNSGMPPESARYLIAAPYEITPKVIRHA